MQKLEFAKRLSEESGLTVSDCRRLMNLVFGLVRVELLKGNEVRLGKVGKLYIKYIKPRLFESNMMGPCEVPAKVRVAFKVFPHMQRDAKRELLEGGYNEQETSD